MLDSGRMGSTRLIVAGIAALVLAAGAGVMWLFKPAAPAVVFVSLQGQRIETADLRGRVVLVNFWATDCTACVKEMPLLVATFEQFHDRGFETIAVAMRHDPPNYVLNYVKQNPLPFTVTLDPLGAIARAFGSVQVTPTTFIIDRRGRIVRRIVGEPDFARLHALIEAELREAV